MAEKKWLSPLWFVQRTYRRWFDETTYNELEKLDPGISKSLSHVWQDWGPHSRDMLNLKVQTMRPLNMHTIFLVLFIVLKPSLFIILICHAYFFILPVDFF